MPRGLLLVLVCGCGSVGGGKQGDASVGDSSHDTGSNDGAPRACSLTKPFGAPVLVGGVNTNSTDDWGWPSADGLTLYFTSAATSSSNYDVYYATRSQPSGAFSGAALLGGVNTTDAEERPTVTADGLTMYVQSNAQGMLRIYVATRTSTAQDFGALSPVTAVNSTTANDGNPWISADGRTLYMTSTRGGNYDIYRATRASTSAPFTAPTPVGELNTGSVEDAPVVSADGLEIYFASTQGVSGASPRNEIFHATRSTPTDGFGTATKVDELSTVATEDFPNWISDDRCTLIFSSDRTGGNGGYDIWTATRPL